MARRRASAGKKLHIGVDDQGQIVASTVTESHEQDSSQVPALLSQVEGEIDRFVADGIYDKEPVYAAVEQHSPGAQVTLPAQRAGLLPGRSAPQTIACSETPALHRKKTLLLGA